MHSLSITKLAIQVAGVAVFISLFMACSDDPDSPNLGDAGTGKDGLAIDSGAPGEKPLLIDDFEDGDGQTTLAVNSNYGYWYSYDDKTNGGGSTISYSGAEAGKAAMNGPGYNGSNRSMEVTATFDIGTMTIQPYVGWGAYFADKAAPVDFSTFKGVGYTYKGAAHMVRIETFEVTDYDVYLFMVTASTDWKTVTIPFTDFAQEGWGKRVPLNLNNVGNISFAMRGSTGQTSTVAIDDLVFLTSTGPKVPDLVVRDPAPPSDGTLDSLEISNPLQAKAMQYLTKGYNITNWLEQSAFTGFTYDETFVANLAKAGFKSLRLPVDLDRYATHTGSGETMTISMDPQLFTVLDAFNTWTTKYGLSLTIDYHQYDYSLSMKEPDSLTKAVLCWGQVAAHFATNPREDLFYELLNEPDLSFDQNAKPNQDEWTSLAERMIQAIRAVDSTHTLIFGDTNWYGIGTLKTRKPFADPNIIYAFHFYEPFIFTHQGAGWANMAPTHDIPYPYDPDRWSVYSSDLGFNTSMPSWILSAVQNYYGAGHKSWIRNQILEMKKWAVTHNLPVICNEFGVNDTTSQVGDRIRYYTDLIAIYDELQIPWQIWFMIMDKATGMVAPELRAALKLN